MSKAESKSGIAGRQTHFLRIGPEGTVAVEGKSDTVTTRVFLDDQPLADAFWSSLPARLADWGDVAVAIYAADRLCRRPVNRITSDWGRIMTVQIPVRDPAFWTDRAVQSRVSSLLAYLSDDEWQLEFVKRKEAGRQAEQPTLFPEQIAEPASAALFSGGLDSLAGLVTFLESVDRGQIALFSAHTGKRTQKPQRDLLGQIARFFPKRVVPVTASFGFRAGVGHRFDDEERSQRTRSFAFQTFGIITAELAGARELMVFENGVGAINLPYVDSQVGSQSNRATNPVTLSLMGELARRILGHEFSVRLPFIGRTKAQAVSALIADPFRSMIRDSISCDHFPQRNAGADQCGACTSCLLRRQALHTNELGDFDRLEYVHDVLKSSEGPKLQGWYALRAMDSQVRRMRSALTSGTPFQSLIATFPTLHEAALALDDAQYEIAQDDLVQMYRTYVDEWTAFRADCANAN